MIKILSNMVNYKTINSFLVLNFFILLALPNHGFTKDVNNKNQSFVKVGASVLGIGSVLYFGWSYMYVNFYRKAISSAPAISINLLPPEDEYIPVLFVGEKKLTIEQHLLNKRIKFNQAAASNSAWSCLLKKPLSSCIFKG